MMKILEIEPEFQSLIPPLRDEEYQQLADSLIDEGCRDTLVVWGDVIVDGHNRYAICRDLDIDFKTINKDFRSDDDAKLWIIKNQLGRRNLTDADRTIMIGLRYQTEKRINAFQNQPRSESGRFARGVGNRPIGRTADIIADDMGIGSTKVKESEHFLNGYENIKAVDPNEAELIRQDKSKLTKTTIQELRKAEPEEIRQAIEDAYKPKEPSTRYIKLDDDRRPRTSGEKEYEQAADVFLAAIVVALSSPESFKNSTKKSKAYKLTRDIEEHCSEFIEQLSYN